MAFKTGHRLKHTAIDRAEKPALAQSPILCGKEIYWLSSQTHATLATSSGERTKPATKPGWLPSGPNSENEPGINAPVAGLLLAALYKPIWRSAVHSAAEFCLALVTFGAFDVLEMEGEACGYFECGRGTRFSGDSEPCLLKQELNAGDGEHDAEQSSNGRRRGVLGAPPRADKAADQGGDYERH